MRSQVPEQFRITPADAERLRIPAVMASTAEMGMNGLFYVPYVREMLRCIVSDQAGWEHVSVSLRSRCPTWGEMCAIKNLFWDEDEVVVQFHPAKSDYVNCHPYCLHLWRPVGGVFPMPPAEMVGPR